MNDAENVDSAVIMWERMFFDVADQQALVKVCRTKGIKNLLVMSELLEIRRDRD